LITIIQSARSFHSVAFEKNWKWKINLPHGSSPIVIHVGEGTDAAASREIDRLIRWNLFRKSLIGIHGVAMDERQARGFTALVWCPVSNYFLLDRTARIGMLKKSLPILFGTDSTLTAGWNIWDHLRLARKEGSLTDKELLDTLTVTPAKIWGLEHTGTLMTGQFADLVIARPRKSDERQNTDLQDLDRFYSLDPEDILLVMHRGRIRLFDDTLYDTFASAGFGMDSFKPVGFNDKRKYVYGDLPGLVKKIREYYPAAAFPFTID
jgi:cytosine/adenosine deaminase-related metal-dependent hydrolase